MGVRPFTPGELARMGRIQKSAMQDECQLLSYDAGTANAFGLDAESYTLVQGWPCGFRPQARGESMNEAQVGEKLAEVRLPLEAEADLATTTRLKLTKRYGQIQPEPLTFEIVGLPERGPSGLVLKVRQVTDGSDE